MTPFMVTVANVRDDARDKLFWFLCGWLGGPNHFIDRFGHPRLRARHLPFKIGQVERDQYPALSAAVAGEVKSVSANNSMSGSMMPPSGD